MISKENHPTVPNVNVDLVPETRYNFTLQVKQFNEISKECYQPDPLTDSVAIHCSYLVHALASDSDWRTGALRPGTLTPEE